MLTGRGRRSSRASGRATAAIPTIAAGEPTKGRTQKTAARTTSEATINVRRGSRSMYGPANNPIAIDGRNWAIMSALTHTPEFVRSLTSTVSASSAKSVPKLEPSVAKKSSR